MKSVWSFYRFTPLQTLNSKRDAISAELNSLGIVGTVLLAHEGINVSLAHQHEHSLQPAVRCISDCLNLRFDKINKSVADDANPVFFRLKVRVVSEIVSFGETIDEASPIGEHVSADTWDDLLNNPDVLVLDVRNDYEIAIGSFPASQTLGLQRFRDFRERVKHLDIDTDRPVAMYCTGGIRCEKASSLLLEKGVKQVYQLEDGILGYLRERGRGDSNWQGECFVFDQRVSVEANLGQGSYEQCHACRHPITQNDLESPRYERGVSCPYCYDRTTKKQKSQFAERARQERLAVARGQRHVGQRQD